LQQKLQEEHPQKINLDLFGQSIRSEYT